MQDLHSQNAKNILERLRDVTNAKTDTELAKILNINQSTISTWKSRNSVDYRLIIDAFSEYDLNYIFLGVGVAGKRNDANFMNTIVKEVSMTPLERKRLEVNEQEVANLRKELEEQRNQTRELIAIVKNLSSSK